MLEIPFRVVARESSRHDVNVASAIAFTQPIVDGIMPFSVNESPTSSTAGRSRGRKPALIMTGSHAPNDQAMSAPITKTARRMRLALAVVVLADDNAGGGLEQGGGGGDDSDEHDELDEHGDSYDDDSVGLPGAMTIDSPTRNGPGL